MSVLLYNVGLTSHMKTKSPFTSALCFSACVALVNLVGCASAPTVRSHPDSAVDYSSYQTFALLRSRSFGGASNRDLTPELIRRTMESAQAAFAAKGLVPTAQYSADLLVLVHGGVEQKLDVNDHGLSYGRFGLGFSPIGGRYELSAYKEGTLLIDVFDGKTRELIWRGTAVDIVNQAPTPEKAKAVVEAIVARYPN